ncbi:MULTISPECIES: hypothetical protein [Helicobacter]
MDSKLANSSIKAEFVLL